MGLLDNTTQQQYYQGSDYGNYQFTSLNDVINQFIVAYVGEDKIISKIKRTDVAFHAQRAMQELSFDTFKSIKSQEIVLPASLQMILPHDYVNYTRVLWTDDSGIKHPLYPTSDTQNPFKIEQDDNGNYTFDAIANVLIPNNDFSSALNSATDWNQSSSNPAGIDTIGVVGGQLEFFHNVELMQGINSSRHYAVWQAVDVSEVETMSITAEGLSSATGTGKSAGIVRIGISTLVDFNQTLPGPTGYDPNRTNPNLPNPSRNSDVSIYNLTTLNSLAPSYIEFNSGNATLTSGTLTDVDVSNETTVYLLIVSDGGQNAAGAATGTNAMDNVTVSFDSAQTNLQSAGESTTWSNYKSNTPSENNNDDYEDDTYWPSTGQRYGLDPQHAQTNGSYYIDNLKGLIHFSSNCSGKTIVLDYISDSLGTDDEMQVHKFAEEAMYKWIAYAILSTRANTQEYIVQRYKKERFAAIRAAKLRLSNIKLEELTQILRGKSKQIKH